MNPDRLVRWAQAVAHAAALVVVVPFLLMIVARIARAMGHEGARSALLTPAIGGHVFAYIGILYLVAPVVLLTVSAAAACRKKSDDPQGILRKAGTALLLTLLAAAASFYSMRYWMR